ncbi:phosphoenolpyruvate--protein phosphotransferase [uncultured Thiodictyon sp.]|uniref:phosphoenolpyruvate--protein phosphotransferase n=1 Tax=uncultured Thiodictyon sp. TaxID=1846217 RepID=UPI0025CD914A|nr:phosphoenolpyruvate--protein phosphotransferase [uncultured Thiodictyon sp.]
MTIAFQGIGVAASQSVAIGPAYLTGHGLSSASPTPIHPEQVGGELNRLNQAVAAARRALKMVRAQVPHATPLNIAEFIDAHLLMLEDVALVDEVRKIIRDQLYCAEWALQMQRDILVRVFDAMDDPYLRTRRDDVEHVVQQIMSFLQGAQLQFDPDNRDLQGCVVVARDLTPADAIVLRHRGAAAFVTEYGGPVSHTAILARSLAVPAVVGVHNITRYVRPGEPLIVDGETGTVLADPDTGTLDYYRERLSAIEARRQHLHTLVDRPTVSRDGTAISLLANLELPQDAATARLNGAAGVGLYRTEFLYMNRDNLPDEEEHLATYTTIVTALAGLPLTIRTLDLGLDKRSEALGDLGPGASNPALGLRGIRLCLKEAGLFRPQLRAILRASALGPIRVMLPMVANVQEVDAVLALIAQLKEELTREGLAFDPRLPVGAMVEVPAAALIARSLARRMDFLSIGTNDLIQYSLAIDRLDDSVSYLFDPTHPAILRLVRMTIEAGHALDTPVAMCGEMAGDPRFTRLLLALGLRHFSIQPGALLGVKEIILDTDIGELEAHTNRLFARLDDAEPGELLDALEALNRL